MSADRNRLLAEFRALWGRVDGALEARLDDRSPRNRVVALKFERDRKTPAGVVRRMAVRAAHGNVDLAAVAVGPHLTDDDRRECVRIARGRYPDLVPRLLALWPHLSERGEEDCPQSE